MVPMLLLVLSFFDAGLSFNCLVPKVPHFGTSRVALRGEKVPREDSGGSNVLSSGVNQYRSYLSTLWSETSMVGRKKFNRVKLERSVKALKKDLSFCLREDESLTRLTEALVEFEGKVPALLSPLDQGDHPEALQIGRSGGEGQELAGTSEDTPQSSSSQSLESELESESESEELSSPVLAKKPKKKTRSVLRGALMGVAVALWVFSGNFVFTGLFTAMVILGQLE